MKYFTFNRKSSEPETIISSCLNSLCDRITGDLERKGYYWSKSWGVKRYESLILAKFILDHSFEKTMNDQISNDEKSAYYFLSNTLFVTRFNDEFSEVGINYDDMKDEVDNKIKNYSLSINDSSLSPECYHKIYMLISGSRSLEELNKDIRKQTVCIKFLQVNHNFSHMAPIYEEQLKLSQQKASAFHLAEIMLPHMMRSARHVIKNINVRKLKTLSKKLSKEKK